MKVEKLRQLIENYYKKCHFTGKDRARIKALESYIEAKADDASVTYFEFIASLCEEERALFSDEFLMSGTKAIKLVFQPFWCSLAKDREWQAGNYELDTAVYYPGNLESVPDHAVLYSAHDYRYLPTKTTYSSPLSLPIIHQSDLKQNEAYVDHGPNAYTAQHLKVSSKHPIAAAMIATKHKERSITTAKEPEHNRHSSDPKKHNHQWWKLSLAQEQDIDAYFERIKAAYLQLKSRDNVGFLLLGASRGAATTFTTIAHKYNKLTELGIMIAGAIMEAPFYEVQGDLESKVYFNQRIMKLVSHHNTEGITPGNSVSHFPDAIPVLFISSKLDKRVPYKSTRKLAEALFKHRQDKIDSAPVYFLTLEHVSHPAYIYEHPEDRQRYLSTVHAFRKYIGLSYINEYVNDDILEQSRLTQAKLTDADELSRDVIEGFVIELINKHYEARLLSFSPEQLQQLTQDIDNYYASNEKTELINSLMLTEQFKLSIKDHVLSCYGELANEHMNVVERLVEGDVLENNDFLRFYQLAQIDKLIATLRQRHLLETEQGLLDLSLQQSDFTADVVNDAATTDKIISCVKNTYHIDAILHQLTSLGVGNNSTPGTSPALSKLRYREHPISKKGHYRETNDSKRIMEACIAQIKQIIRSENQTVSWQHFNKLYLLFVNKISEHSSERYFNQLMAWLKTLEIEAGSLLEHKDFYQTIDINIEGNQMLIAKHIAYAMGKFKTIEAIQSLFDAIGIGKYKEAGNDMELSKLRYRKVRSISLINEMGYRETNDSQLIASAGFVRAKELLFMQGNKINSPEEYQCYRDLFDRQIDRNKKNDRSELVWLDETIEKKYQEQHIDNFVY